MLRRPVESSGVASVGYDPATRTLELEYAGGGVYRYFGVPESEHRRLLDAESIGAFVNAEIKGVYPYAKVDEHGPAP